MKKNKKKIRRRKSKKTKNNAYKKCVIVRKTEKCGLIKRIVQAIHKLIKSKGDNNEIKCKCTCVCYGTSKIRVR